VFDLEFDSDQPRAMPMAPAPRRPSPGQQKRMEQHRNFNHRRKESKRARQVDVGPSMFGPGGRPFPVFPQPKRRRRTTKVDVESMNEEEFMEVELDRTLPPDLPALEIKFPGIPRELRREFPDTQQGWDDYIEFRRSKYPNARVYPIPQCRWKEYQDTPEGWEAYQKWLYGRRRVRGRARLDDEAAAKVEAITEQEAEMKVRGDLRGAERGARPRVVTTGRGQWLISAPEPFRRQ
jgi:hypothetical protein